MKIIPSRSAMKSAMYKLTVFFTVLVYSSAKTVKKDLRDVGPVGKDSVSRKVCLSDASKDILWVLDLNDDELNFKQLRSPNKMDRRVFREIMEPAIMNYKHQQRFAASKKTTANTTDYKTEVDTESITRYDVKKLILRMFNKVIMPYQGEPSLRFHLGDNNKVSIKLYFKGPYTFLVMRYKNQRWNYFLRPPSSLPRWFYEKHSKVSHSGQAMYVDIPDNIRTEFYGKLFFMLQGFLNYTL